MYFISLLRLQGVNTIFNNSVEVDISKLLYDIL